MNLWPPSWKKILDTEFLWRHHRKDHFSLIIFELSLSHQMIHTQNRTCCWYSYSCNDWLTKKHNKAKTKHIFVFCLTWEQHKKCLTWYYTCWWFEMAILPASCKLFSLKMKSFVTTKGDISPTDVRTKAGRYHSMW